MIDSETVTLDVLKATVSREQFAESVAVVARALSTRASVLVLGGIQLTATAEGLALAATDMELSLRASMDAEVASEGTVVVPGRLLLDIARALAGVGRLDRASGRGLGARDHERLGQLPDPHLLGRGLPSPAGLEGIALQEVDRELLLGTIARVSKSASRDESRPVLTGIFASFEAGKLVMAATDSYRLAVKETAAPGPLPDLEAIIPARALQEVARIAGSGDTIEMAVQENHVIFGSEGTWLTTRRIDGQFPNYRQLLPEQFEHELELPRDELLDVVRRVGLLAQRNSPLRLRFAEGELTVSARTQDVGEAKESLPAPFAADAAGDRLQRGVPARRARVDRLADRSLQADQPAPPGGAAGRELRTTRT